MSQSDPTGPTDEVDAVRSGAERAEAVDETRTANSMDGAVARKRLEVVRLRRERRRLQAVREDLERRKLENKGVKKKKRVRKSPDSLFDDPDEGDWNDDDVPPPKATESEDDEDTALDPNLVDRTAPKRADAHKEAIDEADQAHVTIRDDVQGTTARRLRQRRSLRLALRLLFLVVLPTVVAAVYYYRYASPRYESEALLTIYSAETIDPVAASGLGSLIGLGAGSTLVMDGLSVREYIFSRDMLRRLDAEQGFIQHYKDHTKDWLSRVPSDATFEEAYADFEDWVEVEVDPNSGVATLTVVAYSAEAAQRFAGAIIKYSEEMVNQLSERARSDQVRFAADDLAKAEARLRKAREDLVAVQQERGEYNPEQSAMAQLQIRTSLEAELAKARAEVAQYLAVMTPDAPAVLGAKERVRSLAGQVSATSRRMVSNDGDKSLNKSASQFEGALVEKELATAAYQIAMQAAELARAQAARKHRYLATIAPPSLPDESTLPKRGLNTVTAFLCSFLFMGIGSLLLATIKEHSQL